MSTEQKYDGKESHANSLESIEQSVNPDSQAENFDHLADVLSPEQLAEFMHLSAENRMLVVTLVESGERAEKVAATIYELAGKAQTHALPPGIFDFDELAIFADLSTCGKTVILSLANLGIYQPEQLKRALAYISNAPHPTAGPDGLINDKSLQSILAGEQSPFTIEGARGQTAQPMAVELPFFLQWQIKDAQKTKALLAAIERVFHKFSSSEDGKKIEEDGNQMLAYSALRMAFMELAEKAATKLGTLDKPRPSDFLFDLPHLATGDPELDKAPILVDNPFDCIDVGVLQEWVRDLQNMSQLQQKISTNLDEINTVLKSQVGDYERLVEQYKQIVAEYKQKEALRQQLQDVPSALPYVDLTLYLHNGAESEVELVRQALADARDAKLKEVLSKVVVDDTEDAFFLYEDFVRLQSILGRLATEVTETASNSYSKTEYTDRPSHYLSQVKSDHQKLMTRKEAFVDEYSVFTHPDPEEQESTPSADASDTTSTEKLPE